MNYQRIVYINIIIQPKSNQYIIKIQKLLANIYQPISHTEFRCYAIDSLNYIAKAQVIFSYNNNNSFQYRRDLICFYT